MQGAAAQAALATAAATTVASVVLADPGQQSNTGVVLSLAPLLGANPEVDRLHPRWLHVHVRPHVRGLLKLLKVHALYLAGCIDVLLCQSLLAVNLQSVHMSEAGVPEGISVCRCPMNVVDKAGEWPNSTCQTAVAAPRYVVLVAHILF